MKCPACGNENPVGASFCEECGARLQPGCPACGSEVSPNAKFCRSCGAPLDEFRVQTSEFPERVGAPPRGARGSELETALAPSAGRPQVPSQPTHPVAFCDGRYRVVNLLGEGGKKRVYLAHDTKLDRDVAFALIKTEGLDAEGQARIRREAQAMARLGDHPHIVPVYDIGEEPSAGARGWGLGVRRRRSRSQGRRGT